MVATIIRNMILSDSCAWPASINARTAAMLKSYSIDGLASVMALQEITNTVEAAAELGPKAKVK